VSEKLDPQEFSQTLNGFDELAISRMFGSDISELAATLQVRALEFVRLRREGMKDRDAHRRVMEMLRVELEEQWKNDNSEADQAGDDTGKDWIGNGPSS
jgi:hypothetical protein